MITCVCRRGIKRYITFFNYFSHNANPLHMNTKYRVLYLNYAIPSKAVELLWINRVICSSFVLMPRL